MELWQWIATTVVALGLSPAPWVTALLLGRLRPLSWVREQIAAKDAVIDAAEIRHAAEVEALQREKDYERERADVERNRNDALSARLGALANELGGTAVQLLRALPTPSSDPLDEGPAT